MRPPGRTHRGDDEDLAMTSMIDVVFLLLVFFVWTSSFDLPETNLPGRIAMAAEPTEKSPDTQSETDTDAPTRPPLESEPSENRPSEIVVRLLATPGGTVYQVGAIGLSNLDEVRAKLAAIAQLPISPIVIIDPEPTITVNETIATFDLARELAFAQVLLAVETP